MISCLMALSLLPLLSPIMANAQCTISPEFRGPFPYPTTPIDPWPPNGQCPNFWHGYVSDPKDMGFPLNQGVCLDGEWRDDPITIEENVPVTMRDGVKLAADIFRPGKPGKYPVIMTFGGVKGKAVYGTGKGWAVPSHRYSDHTTFEGIDPGFFVPEGFVVIMVDSRGYGNSGGCRTGNPEDYYDGIEWAGTQAWSNGNVGMIGVSALGNVQWEAAALRPPHLKAIAPWEAGGAAPPIGRFGGLNDCTFPATTAGRFPALRPNLGQCIPKETRSFPLVLENITVPVLACVSSSDQLQHTYGTDFGWRHVSSKQKWLYNHGGQKWARFYGTDGQAFQLMFFNHFLKGNDDRILYTPRVRYEVRETLDKFSVRYEEDWPIPRTKYQKLYLDAGTRRLDVRSVTSPGKTSYDSTITEVAIPDTSSFNNTRFVPVVEHETVSTVDAPGRAIFDYKFDQDTELTGHMMLKVWVAAEDADDMALFVTVKKLDTTGNEVFFDCSDSSRKLPVAVGWMKLSMRELDPKLSTPYQPVQAVKVAKVSPGEIVPAEIGIVLSSTLFRKGETLRLIISGDTQVYSTRHHFEKFNKGMCSIYTGGKYDSYLQIPVIPPQETRHAFSWPNNRQ